MLHSEEQSCKSHCRSLAKCHTVPLNFYFFCPSFPPSPPSPSSWHPSLPVQANRRFLRFRELNVGLHLTRRISDIFTQFFTNLYTNGFKSWHEKFWTEFYQAAVYGRNPSTPFFSFFLFLIHLCFSFCFFFVVFFNLPSQIFFQPNGHKNVRRMTLLVHLY